MKDELEDEYKKLTAKIHKEIMETYAENIDISQHNFGENEFKVIFFSLSISMSQIMKSIGVVNIEDFLNDLFSYTLNISKKPGGSLSMMYVNKEKISEGRYN